MSGAVRRALYHQLVADSSGTASLLYNEGLAGGMLGAPPPNTDRHSIYHNWAPEDASYPFVIFQKQSGVLTNAIAFGQYSGTTLMHSELWTVKGVAQGGGGTSAEQAAERIADRIDFLLHSKQISIQGAAVFEIYHETDVEYPEVIDGVEYQHTGAMYRVEYK